MTKTKIIAIYCGVHNIWGSKMSEKNRTKDGRGIMEVYCWKVIIPKSI